MLRVAEIMPGGSVVIPAARRGRRGDRHQQCDRAEERQKSNETNQIQRYSFFFDLPAALVPLTGQLVKEIQQSQKKKQSIRANDTRLE